VSATVAYALIAVMWIAGIAVAIGFSLWVWRRR